MSIALPICTIAAIALQPGSSGTLPSTAAVERAPAAATAPVDLKPLLAPSALRNGRTTIYDDGRLRLVTKVRRGKLLSVNAINLTGKPMWLANQRGAPVGASRPCIYCYNLDQPLASTCIELPCDEVRKLRGIELSIE